MNKKLAAAIATGALLLSAVSAFAVGDYDNWRGTMVDNSNVSDLYDDASGHVVLNYRSGKDDWVVNVTARGLDPDVSYQVIYYDGAVLSFGCFYPNRGGTLHVNTKGYSGQIDPTKVSPEPRVNIRLDNPATGEVCDGIANSAKLTTYSSGSWGGSGLIPSGSERPE